MSPWVLVGIDCAWCGLQLVSVQFDALRHAPMLAAFLCPHCLQPVALHGPALSDELPAREQTLNLLDCPLRRM